MKMKKALAMFLAVVMIVAVSVAGTIAWLMDTSDAVTNTFSVGDINISLAETTGDNYTIVPGNVEDKDPKVTVKEGSEDCWVFVQVQEVNNSTTKYIDWSIGAGWNALTGDDIAPDGTKVYYRSYPADDSDTGVYNVLSGGENGQVSYPDTLTKAHLDAIDGLAEDETTEATGEIAPQLIFKAFAVQKDASETALGAWNNIPEEQHLGYVASST